MQIDVPAQDCDIVLKFPNGKELTIQCRPSNADVDYNGSLDIILPQDQAVSNWIGTNMQPAPVVENDPCTHLAQQLVMELPFAVDGNDSFDNADHVHTHAGLSEVHSRASYLDAAVGQAETYRAEESHEDDVLEVGHLYGMADLITALTLGPTESFSDTREAIARQIDSEAAKTSYSVLKRKRQ